MMAQRRTVREVYYIDGSTVRKKYVYDEAAPARPMQPSYDPDRRTADPRRAPQRRTAGAPVRDPRRTPERRPESDPRRVRKTAAVKQPVTYRVSAIKARKSLAFDFKYTAFLAFAMVLMIFSCANMIRMESKLDGKKSNISSLQSEIRDMKADNEAFENSLSDSYTLEEIYNIAVNELGMVYSQKGQILYYDTANEDYVNQYQDVPSAD